MKQPKLWDKGFIRWTSGKLVPATIVKTSKAGSILTVVLLEDATICYQRGDIALIDSFNWESQ